MKKLALAIALIMPICQEASASYVDTTTNYTYTWSCYNSDCAGGSNYIDQFQIYVRPNALGVNYSANQTSQFSTNGDALILIGLYTNSLLSAYFDESSATITQASGVNFTYNASGNNSLPDHTAMFGSEDKNSGQPALGLNELNEWVNLNLAYLTGVTQTSFIDNAMFSSDHYIFVHLQGTGTSNNLSEKWKLTWADTNGGGGGGGGGGGTIPEPGTIALLGLGLLGMGMTRLNKKA